MVDVKDLDKLQSEIDALREKSDESPPVSLEQFLEDMRELISVAKDQQSPIVFV